MKFRKPQFYQIFWILFVSAIFAILNTIGGWMIVDKMVGDSQFPGIASLEFWGGVIQLIALFLLIGILFSLVSLIFPSFRKNWKTRIHIPMWAGVLISGLFMIIVVLIGYFAV